jgi:AcrR family transcriptional regulator
LSAGPTRRRLPRAKRRVQIIEAVLKVVAEHGVPSATVARIAAAAGVSEGTLYVYFASRDEMLTAALDSIFADMSNLIDSSAGMSAPERLTTIAERHSELMKTDRSGFAMPWVEFIAAGPQVGLREAVARTQTKAFDKMLAIVEEGRADGTIREDLDARRIIWQWYTIMWADNISSLMGLSEYIDAGHARYSLDLLLRDATVKSLEGAAEANR